MIQKNLSRLVAALCILCMSFGQSFAWNGLIADVGDILTNTKWNEMIGVLNGKLDASDVTAGTGINVTQSGSELIITSLGGGGGGSVPYLDDSELTTIKISEAITISIFGQSFTPTSNVTIPGFDGTISSVNVVSPTEIQVTLTPGTAEAIYDIIVDNAGVLNTVWPGNGENMLEVTATTWVDLRAGGETFTWGVTAGSDIRIKSGMSLARDANGMYFTGAGPWGSWAKFESLGWTRGENRTVEWIFTDASSAMMLGVGSTATLETNNAQYYQHETLVYIQTANTMWGLFGNNGTPGGAGNQSSSTTISGCVSNVYKAQMTNDGSKNGIFKLYCLPSANEAVWDDTSILMKTLTIGGSLNPDEVNIMPSLIPANGGAQRFIAVRAE